MPTIDPLLPSANTASNDADRIAPAERAKAEKAAEKFESMFISEMFKRMRSTTAEFAGEDSIFKDRINSEMLDMADGAVADSMAGQRAFGIADAILKQLLPAPQTPAAAHASAPGTSPTIDSKR